MIHLLAAHEVDPAGNALYWVGSVAPDAVSNWKEKEITHYRNLSDRKEAITELAAGTDRNNAFEEGMLLHLFVDWKWDVSVKEEYIARTGENWFPKYRHELGLSSSFAFHHTDWSREIWRQIDSCDISDYGLVNGATAEEVKELISRNSKWHHDFNIGPSAAFPPELIESFIDRVVKDYSIWRG